mmetsp:Transcript_3177/g.4597  ORF Transcript_3177/g.4597 Transcript_3177/m.4597 type:complete len:113 (+) Transcript_3177:174-512(+)
MPPRDTRSLDTSLLQVKSWEQCLPILRPIFKVVSANVGHEPCRRFCNRTTSGQHEDQFAFHLLHQQAMHFFPTRQVSALRNELRVTLHKEKGCQYPDLESSFRSLVSSFENL